MGLAAGAAQPLPQELRDTGLYEEGAAATVRAGNLPFEPQYPLWSDGTTKRRWVALPPGTAIDARNADAWDFPAGTRFWKQFGYDRPVETRYIERLADGSWRYATYVWNEAGTSATLAPEDGVVVAAKGAPGGRWVIPSRNDCLACHEGPAVPVLGFSALQLSSELAGLIDRGLLRNLPRSFQRTAPRIAAANPTARAALGYLHGNCGHCHNDGALSGVELKFSQAAARPAETAARTLAAVAGRKAEIITRLTTDNPYKRMPPIGVRRADTEGAALIERWMQQDLRQQP